MMETRLKVQQYGRLHGLFTDHTLHHPVSLALTHLEDSAITQTLDESESLPWIRVPANFTINEKLAISKGGAMLLAEMKPPIHSLKHTITLRENVKPTKKLRLELPILGTDPELDLRNTKKRLMPDLKNLGIPFEAVNKENDRGLQWPSHYYKYHEDLSNGANTEKLSVPQHVLSYLQTIIKAPTASEDGAILPRLSRWSKVISVSGHLT